MPEFDEAMVEKKPIYDGLNIYQRLALIQSEMKVPKNLYNAHGNFNYRNAETILEVAKPICKKYGCVLILQDRIVPVGDRFYVDSIVRLTAIDDRQETVTCEGLAREPVEQKGMNAAQITGSSSSYARKYALNGLFCIDDGTDADTADNTVTILKADEFVNRYEELKQEFNKVGVDIHADAFVKYICEKANVETIDPGKLVMNLEDATRVIKWMEGALDAKKV